MLNELSAPATTEKVALDPLSTVVFVGESVRNKWTT
jgi:hypothetical protein